MKELHLSCFLVFFAYMVVKANSRVPVDDRELLSKSLPRLQQSSQAYVTLLYGDEFALGVRVLGKSIRDTGTTRDMVCLVSEGVSTGVVNLLQADGWIIDRIDLLANPNTKRPKRFWGVYTKLKIFNMTNYKKVVYLDADTIVMKNIDDLFLCEKFCANLKHSERLNSGVMVVEPSQELFNDMMMKVNTLPSYTGGDQGFLNSYYADFPNAHLFDPNLSEEERHKQAPKNMERLSTLYNADVGLYMLANKWMVNETELRIVHYTLGPLKPWDWWTAWIVEPARYWQDIRVTLEESLPGTAAGQDPHMRLVVWILSLVPLVVMAFLLRHILFQVHKSIIWNGSIFHFTRQLMYKCRAGSNLPYYSNISSSPPHVSGVQHANGHAGVNSNNTILPSHLEILSVIACFIIAGISIGIAMSLIPKQVMPSTGLVLLYEWTFFLFTLFFGWYLEAMSRWGRASVGLITTTGASLQYNSIKGHSKQIASWDAQTMLYSMGMASLAILAPSLPLVFGVTALFARLGMVIGGAMVLVVFMTYTCQRLAARWFIRGRETVSPPRSMSDISRL